MRLGFSLEIFGHRMAFDVRPEPRRFGYGTQTIDGVELEVGSPAWRDAMTAQHAAEVAAAVTSATEAAAASRELADTMQAQARRLEAERDHERAVRDHLREQLEHERIAAKAAERDEGRN